MSTHVSLFFLARLLATASVTRKPKLDSLVGIHQILIATQGTFFEPENLGASTVKTSSAICCGTNQTVRNAYGMPLSSISWSSI